MSSYTTTDELSNLKSHCISFSFKDLNHSILENLMRVGYFKMDYEDSERNPYRLLVIGLIARWDGLMTRMTNEGWDALEAWYDFVAKRLNAHSKCEELKSFYVDLDNAVPGSTTGHGFGTDRIMESYSFILYTNHPNPKKSSDWHEIGYYIPMTLVDACVTGFGFENTPLLFILTKESTPDYAYAYLESVLNNLHCNYRIYNEVLTNDKYV